MSGWRSARLADLNSRDGWVPVRDHFGIAAFGINGWVGDREGETVIAEHAESASGHEELYLVTAGHATFTVDGDEIDAPTGTLVCVRDPALIRRAVAREPGTTVLAIGATPGEAFHVSTWEQGWEISGRAMRLAREQRYAEAADVLRAGIEEHPDHAGFHYNLACFESRRGSPAEVVAAHLRHAIELNSMFREIAASDADFDPVRETPAYRSAVAREPEPGRARA